MAPLLRFQLPPANHNLCPVIILVFSPLQPKLSSRLFSRLNQLCHADRSGPTFSPAPYRHLSSRPEQRRLLPLRSGGIAAPRQPPRAATLFRPAIWRVGPRSATFAPRALRRRGGEICFSVPSLRVSAFSASLRNLRLSFLSLCSFLRILCVTVLLGFVCDPPPIKRGRPQAALS